MTPSENLCNVVPKLIRRRESEGWQEMSDLCFCSDGVDRWQAKSVVGCINEFSPTRPKQHCCHIDFLFGVTSNLEKTGTSFLNGLHDS
jgi:hypothetical protein